MSTPSFSAKCKELVAKERSLNPKITADRVWELVQAAYDAEKAKKPRQKPQDASDEAFLSDLEAKECYKGINIRREHQKALIWAGTRNEGMTRRRFINWLNKVERPMGSVPDPRKKPSAYTAPTGWESILRVMGKDWDAGVVEQKIAGGWSNLSHALRSDIAERAN